MSNSKITHYCTDSPSPDKQAIQDELNQDVAAFLAAGGRIDVVESGAQEAKFVPLRERTGLKTERQRFKEGTVL